MTEQTVKFLLLLGGFFAIAYLIFYLIFWLTGEMND